MARLRGKMDKNYWLDRKLRREQMEYQRDFLQCLSQGGSYIIDWEKVYEKSGLSILWGAPDVGWCHQFDFGYNALEDIVGSD